MDASNILMAANALLLMPVYFILKNLQGTVSELRKDINLLSDGHHYMRGRLDQKLEVETS